MSTSPQVLFIALDSAEPVLIDEWAKQGLLPSIHALMEDGMTAKVTGTPAFGNGCHWPTLATSVDPARHGRWNSVQVDIETRERVSFNERTDFLREPFWAQLSRDGVSIAVIDVPRSPYAPDAKGLQVSEWLTHERRQELRSWPEEFRRRLVEKYGLGELDGDSSRFMNRTDGDYRALTRALKDNIERKTRLCAELLQRHEYDFLFSVFAEAHDIGHLAWHIHDTGHPDFDAELADAIGDPLLEIYVALDEAIGELAAAAPDANIVLFAGPGMEPRYTCNHAMSRLSRAALRHMDGLLARRIEDFGRLMSVIRGDGWPARKLRFWAMPHNENSGAIRINLAGREKEGIVTAGAEYDQCVDTLREYFARLVNVETGGPVVKDVFRVDEICRGPALSSFPDVLVEWDRSAPPNWVHADWLGDLEVGRPPGRRTGDHTQNMSFTVSGAGPGELEGGMELEDIGPTIAGMFGCELPGCDGIARPQMYLGK